MNRHPKLAALAVSAIVLGGSGAAAGDQGPYVGGSLGETTFQHEAANFDDGSLGRSGGVDDSDSGWKLFGGYQFNKHLAVEYGYTVLNKDVDSETTFFGATSDGSGSFAAGGVGIDIHEPRAAFTAAVGILPIGEKLSLFGKVGVQIWEVELTTFDSSGIREEDESGVDPMIGIGLNYRIAGRWGVRAEFERFMNVIDDDIDLVSIGLTYRFKSR